jgi:hypothetical protein
MWKRYKGLRNRVLGGIGVGKVVGINRGIGMIKI